MSSRLLRSARGFFHSRTFHGLLIYNVCSLQIVTEQETCLTKHNGGTRPLLTLLGSGGLPAAGCEQSSRTKENNTKEGVTDSKGESKLSSVAVLRTTSSLGLSGCCFVRSRTKKIRRGYLCRVIMKLIGV